MQIMNLKFAELTYFNVLGWSHSLPDVYDIYGCYITQNISYKLYRIMFLSGSAELEINAFMNVTSETLFTVIKMSLFIYF